jgi:predicted phage terminase large subunit-like protein
MMATRTITRPYLHPAQLAIHQSKARYKVVAAGRRFGKTRLGVTECVKIAVEGGHAWWVAPAYPTGLIGWRLMKTLGAQIPSTLPRETELMMHFAGGGWVQVKSADKPPALRGEGLDLVVVDETAHIPKFPEAWEQSLRPALSDREGDALFISTPKGFNHFWELYKRAETDESWAAFQFPTSTNPYIAAEEIEEAKRQLPSLIFRQEYGAEFVQLAGALFRREWFHVIEKAPQNIEYVRFWDLAASTKTSADYTVGAKVGLTRKGLLVIADVARGRWEWPDAVKVIGQTALMDGVGVKQGIEVAGVQRGMHQILMREPSLVRVGFWPVEVTADKLARCNPWLARAEQGMVAFVRGSWNQHALDEICGFPEVDHDDVVDAISGAVDMLDEPKGYYILGE